jgi:hypothetical protein
MTTLITDGVEPTARSQRRRDALSSDVSAVLAGADRRGGRLLQLVQ